jgi:formylglycine-generating enzyme required for sulfatase activity
MPPVQLPAGTRALARHWLVLAAPGIGAFATTFALVRLGRDARLPVHGPPGMVWVHGGEFTMGSDSDLGWPDEKSAHRVRVDGFRMDEYFVHAAARSARGFVPV